LALNEMFQKWRSEWSHFLIFETQTQWLTKSKLSNAFGSIYQ
jgi:hypothetical protein